MLHTILLIALLVEFEALVIWLFLRHGGNTTTTITANDITSNDFLCPYCKLVPITIQSGNKLKDCIADLVSHMIVCPKKRGQ
jgi:hypothetical protein